MSEQEKVTLYNRLNDAMKQATLKMLERKAKLGEKVIIADACGNPIEMSASDALKLFANAKP